MAGRSNCVSLVVVGLWCYTFTLTGSLHGLRHWQALIVNVCGSSVGNLLPGGGAAGLAATYTICRSWGFSRRDISTSAIVTGVWNVMARIALPVVAIVALYSGAENIPSALEDAALAATFSGLAVRGRRSPRTTRRRQHPRSKASSASSSPRAPRNGCCAGIIAAVTNR